MAGASQVQAATLHQLGNLAQDQERYQSAHDYYAESLRLRRPSASGPDVALTVYQQGLLARRQGQYQEAASRYAECLAVFQRMGDRYNMALVLEDAGGLAVALDQDRVAAALWGAASRIREEIGAPVPPAWADWQARQHQMVQARLGMATWRDAWAHGRSLPVDLGVRYAQDFLHD
jgi:tetratricopeptide (TPR) repeat protein